MTDVEQVKVTTLYRLLLSSGDGQQMPLSVLYARLRSINKNFYCDVNDLREFVLHFNQEFRLSMSMAVTPTTDLGVCHMHSSKSGSCLEEECSELHLCIFFLLSGNCVHGVDCLFGHKLRTPHNHRLLWQHRLEGLNLTELRTLFCLKWVRRGVLVPKVCRYYNHGGGCKKGSDCHAMHVCEYYFGTRDTKCKFGSNCRRNHDIHNPQVEHVLSLYGFSTRRPVSELLEELRDLHQDTNNNSSNSSSYSSDEEFFYGQAQYSGYRSATPNRRQDMGQRGAASLGSQNSQRRHRSASVASHCQHDASLPGWNTRRMSRERASVSEETLQKRPLVAYSGQAQCIQGVERSGREGRRHQRADSLLPDTLVCFNPSAVNLPLNLLDAIQAHPRSRTEARAPGQGRPRGQFQYYDGMAYPETDVNYFSVSNGSEDSFPPRASRSGRSRRN